jgi:hypothetical protein
MMTDRMLEQLDQSIAFHGQMIAKLSDQLSLWTRDQERLIKQRERYVEEKVSR